jgi:secretion/DNA translocation related CpaE-like protein
MSIFAACRRSSAPPSWTSAPEHPGSKGSWKAGETMGARPVAQVTAERPMVMVDDEQLLDDLLRLAAAAGCELERVPDAASARPVWMSAPLVVLDERGAACCARAGLHRRGGIVVVCRGGPPPSVWQSAVEVGAERVLALPEVEPWLVGAFADVVEGPRGGIGRVLAVIGGRGGAGASVFAAAAALTAVRRGGGALLVDCDPLGGGIDLVLGVEDDAGLRWPELALTGGRIAASSLRCALPTTEFGCERLAVLACGRAGEGPSVEAVQAVLDAGRRAGDTVVCDLPRHLPDAACAVLDRADLAALVVPAEVRACAAATPIAETIRARGVRLEVLTRGPAPGGLTAADIARALGQPVLVALRPEPGLAEALERGRMPARARGPLATAAARVLDVLGEGTPRGEAATGVLTGVVA